MTIAQDARFDDPSFYLGDPNSVFKQLRETDPVHWYEDGQFWVITKYDDIRTISTHPNQFRSERIGIMMDLVSAKLGVDPQGYGARGLMFTDPPEHGVQRAAIKPRFTLKSINELEDQVRGVIRDVVVGLPDSEFDWIEHVAEPIPVLVFSRLLGIPEEDWPKVSGWATTIASLGAGNASEEDMNFILNEVGPYLFLLAMERKADPTDDLLTMLTQVTPGGEPLDEVAVTTHALTLLAAGSETTQSLIAGLADCLDTHPEQSQKVFQDRSLVDNAIEETLRWWTPVMSMARQAAEDVELSGTTVKAGDGVLLAYASANRDETKWGATAEDFDISRSDASSQLGFGVGEHFCLGAPLARREVRVLLDELIAGGATGIEVTGERRPRASALVHTHDHLPVRLRR